jgi:hypothetical protein
MKFKLVSLLFLCAIFFCAVQLAYACTCAYQDPSPSSKLVKNEKARVTAVFLGEVISVIPKYDKSTTGLPVIGNRIMLPVFDKNEITFRVDKSWKGETVSEIKISTGVGGSDCGYVFTTGKKYLVYAAEKDGSIWVNSCSRTAQAGVKTVDKEIRILNKLKN